VNAPDVGDWTRDPLEIDRFLDGEMDARERSHREARVARDPGLARRLAGRRAFLAAVAAAASAGRPDESQTLALETRVRSALAGARRRRRLLRSAPVAAAVAAVLLVVVGTGVLAPQADALEPEARLARATWLRGQDGARDLDGPTCAPARAESPWRFPLVERRELGVHGCAEPEGGGGAVQAVLYRPDDQETVGYVARRDPGVRASHDIGVLRLDDVVIFDVRLGGAAYWLAVAREAVERSGSCRACHNRTREGDANPHRFLERRLSTR
jgi:hypothetical protein